MDIHEVYKLMREIDTELEVTVNGTRYKVIDDIDHDINAQGVWQTTYVLEKDGKEHRLDIYTTERPYKFDSAFFDDVQIDIKDVTV